AGAGRAKRARSRDASSIGSASRAEKRTSGHPPRTSARLWPRSWRWCWWIQSTKNGLGTSSSTVWGLISLGTIGLNQVSNACGLPSRLLTDSRTCSQRRLVCSGCVDWTAISTVLAEWVLGLSTKSSVMDPAVDGQRLRGSMGCGFLSGCYPHPGENVQPPAATVVERLDGDLLPQSFHIGDGSRYWRSVTGICGLPAPVAQAVGTSRVG